jgi:ABC-type oligopeptide transport system substrate-binding subunit
MEFQMKRNLATLAMLALLPLAACGDRQETTIEDQPVVTEDPTYVNPAVTEGAIMMDTTTYPTAPVDTAPIAEPAPPQP